MIEGLPAYIPVVFVLTTLVTVGIFIFAISKAGFESVPGRVLIGFVSVWILIHAALGSTNFYRNFETLPPRVFAVGVMPFLLLTFIYLIFFRRGFLEVLPLGVLTLIHVIRIPVEFVLLWLAQNGLVPFDMTFEGRNFDILSGISAPIIYFLAFRRGEVNRTLLIVWNIAALALLANIVTIAVLAFPSSLQMVGFGQPNVGVTYFPFIWLPTVVVPIVFFSHAVSLWKLIAKRDL